MREDGAAALVALGAGHEAYGKGDFGSAIASYEAAVDAGADSAAVHYDLGNACYRAGQLGRAALAYERALRRDPGSEDARHNLALVRSQGRDQVLQGVAEPFLLRLGGRTDPDLAAAGLVGGFWLCCALLLARGRVERALPRLAVTLATLLSLLISAAAGGATWATWRVRTGGWAVVLAQEVPVLQAPDSAAKVAFEIHEGLKVREADRRGEYVRIELPSGLGGWVLGSALERIDGPG